MQCPYSPISRLRNSRKGVHLYICAIALLITLIIIALIVYSMFTLMKNRDFISGKAAGMFFYKCWSADKEPLFCELCELSVCKSSEDRCGADQRHFFGSEVANCDIPFPQAPDPGDPEYHCCSKVSCVTTMKSTRCSLYNMAGTFPGNCSNPACYPV